ncbi:MAG TPA: hypothetical protein VE912_12940 [Bacteroidales bacterium]|nr:hypothetical protein [Bacteroidales bacterium]
MKKTLIGVSGLILFLISACYYDSKEYLYPELNSTCDTTNINFSSIIKPIIDNNCKTCHSGSVPSGNVRLENYTQVKAIADNGKLVGVINGSGGLPLMPPGAPLSSCQITSIEKWVTNGAPDN